MRLSRYTLKIPYDEKSYLLYNTLYESLALIDEETDRLIAAEMEKAPEQRANETISDLLEARILRPSEADEDHEIRRWYEKIRNQAEELKVTILTTNACNMACDYCFEGEALKGSHMRHDVEAAFLRWLDIKLSETNCRRLMIRFFGGEPFLNTKGLLRMAREMKKLCDVKRVALSMNATTNGSLITREVIEELATLGLNFINVTLDGDEELHNEKRPLKNGKNSFQTIWENLKDISGLIQIGIGVNANAGEEKSLGVLLKKLKESPFRESLAGVHVKHVHHKTSEFNDLDYRVTEKTGNDALVWQGMTEKENHKPVDILKGGPCEVHRKANYVVDPKGDLYPCPTAIGRPQAVLGTVFEHTHLPMMGHAGSFFKEYSPLDHPKCKGCSYFPICGGGCRLASFAVDQDQAKHVHCPGEYFDRTVPSAVKKRFDDLSRTNEEKGGD